MLPQAGCVRCLRGCGGLGFRVRGGGGGACAHRQCAGGSGAAPALWDLDLGVWRSGVGGWICFLWSCLVAVCAVVALSDARQGLLHLLLLELLHEQEVSTGSSHFWKPPVEILIFAVVMIKTSHCKVCAWALPRAQPGCSNPRRPILPPVLSHRLTLRSPEGCTLSPAPLIAGCQGVEGVRCRCGMRLPLPP